MATPNIVRQAISACPDPELRASALTEFDRTVRLYNEAASKEVRLINEVSKLSVRVKSREEEDIANARLAARAALPELRRYAAVIAAGIEAAETQAKQGLK